MSSINVLVWSNQLCRYLVMQLDLLIKLCAVFSLNISTFSPFDFMFWKLRGIQSLYEFSWVFHLLSSICCLMCLKMIRVCIVCLFNLVLLIFICNALWYLLLWVLLWILSPCWCWLSLFILLLFFPQYMLSQYICVRTKFFFFCSAFLLFRQRR